MPGGGAPLGTVNCLLRKSVERVGQKNTDLKEVVQANPQMPSTQRVNTDGAE